MSKKITKDNLIATFPTVLAEDVHLRALASATATELVELYENCDMLAIYARIDELDGVLLDVLAYDFKIDWWDTNFSLKEKRETFKQCWMIKRILGTPKACERAFSAIFQPVTLLEWWQYSGRPFYFKIKINPGEAYPEHDKLQELLQGIRYYKNTRSILEAIEFETTKTKKIHVGTALQQGVFWSVNVTGSNLDAYNFLTDEDGVLLLDENGRLLLDSEEVFI